MATKHSIRIQAYRRGENTHIVQATITSSPASISEWINMVRIKYGYQTIVGLGCQWKPNRIGIKSSKNNKIATLQLCIEKECLIIQMFHLSNIPQSLKQFLSDEEYTFVGVGVEDNVAKLLDEYGLSVTCRADLHDLAVEKKSFLYTKQSIGGVGVESLASDLLRI